MDSWGPERSAELATLCTAALPDERLTSDELLAACWDDPGAVLALPDGSGAVSVVVRRVGDWATAFVKLLVVDPEVQRTGRGATLLGAAETWAWDQGAGQLAMAGSAPFYLWPGVDVSFTAMHCLAEAAGYVETGATFDMEVPGAYRHPVPVGVELRTSLDDHDAQAIAHLVTAAWPEWSAEVQRGIEQGTCVGAFETETETETETRQAVAFACHSVNRAGWFGPTGTAPAWRHRGIGSALLSQVCVDLSVAGYTRVEICWIGPVGFYAEAGGSISRVFRTYRKARPKLGI